MLLEPFGMERTDSVSSFESFRAGTDATESLMMSIMRAGTLDDIQRMVGRLDEEGALCSINDVLAGGRSPLHLAVAARRKDAVCYLLNEGALIDHVDEQGRTALHQAVIDNQAKLVHLLLENGADPFLGDSGSVMPIALNASSDCVTRMLLEACARKISTPSPSLASASSSSVLSSSSNDARTDQLIAPCAWTHYDLSRASGKKGDFRLPSLLPRARCGRYVVTEEDVHPQVKVRSPEVSDDEDRIVDSEQEQEDRWPVFPENGRSHTLPRRSQTAPGKLPRRISCPGKDTVGGELPIPGADDHDTAHAHTLSRSSSARSSLRKRVGSAMRALKRSTEDVSRSSFRRKSSGAERKPSEHGRLEGRKENGTLPPLKLIPEGDVTAKRTPLVPRAPTTLSVVNTPPSLPKSTTF